MKQQSSLRGTGLLGMGLLTIGLLGASAVAAQSTVANQAGVSAQSQSTMPTNSSGAQVSGNGSAAASSSMAASTNAENGEMKLSDGTKIDATLATSLDAKRSKPGDEVEARTAEDVKQDGKVVLKKGTHLVGHVALAQARANGQAQSQLGIVFDRAVLKNGQAIPFTASIQALASAQSVATTATGADDMMASGGEMGAMRGSARGGAGLAGGVTSTAGATTGAVMNTAASVPSTAGATLNAGTRSASSVGGLTAGGRLASNSSGVFGIEGVSIDSAASTATQGSMIVSSTKNVHLDSGTQMLLRTSAQAQ